MIVNNNNKAERFGNVKIKEEKRKIAFRFSFLVFLALFNPFYRHRTGFSVPLVEVTAIHPRSFS
jgi:hypothetical protein